MKYIPKYQESAGPLVSNVRRTEPSFKSNDKQSPVGVDPFLQKRKELQNREIDDGELKQKIEYHLSGPEKTWYEKWKDSPGGKALDAVDLGLDVATIAYPPVSVVTVPLGSLISIPNAVLGAVDAVQNGLSLQNTGDMLGVIPMGNSVKQGTYLLKKFAKKNTKRVRYTTPYGHRNPAHSYRTPDGEIIGKQASTWRLMKEDPKYLYYHAPHYLQDAVTLTGDAIGVIE